MKFLLLLVLVLFSCSDRHIPPTPDPNQQEYNRLIEEADSYYSNNQWELAEYWYAQALTIFPGDAYAKTKYEECLNEIRNGHYAREGSMCTKIIAKADEYYEQENYSRAQALFERVLLLKCSDSVYVQEQMKRIEEIMNLEQR